MLWMSKLVSITGDPHREPSEEERESLRKEGFVSEMDRALTLCIVMRGTFKQGDQVKVSAYTSEEGKGLTYGGFTGTVVEDGRVGGWDVYDVMINGELQAVYGFSISVDTKK